jgi:hypothetical protein
VVHFFLSLDRHDEVQHFALDRAFLLICLHLLHLQLVYVVGGEVVPHEIVHELGVDLFGSLVFLLEGLFSAFGVG